MSDSNQREASEEPAESQPEEGEAIPTGPASTPLDHPYFLPAILGGMAVWFGYDGWFNSDPDMQEHLTFNRVGFAILLPLFLWFGYKGYKEMQEAGDDEAGDGDRPPPIA